MPADSVSPLSRNQGLLFGWNCRHAQTASYGNGLWSQAYRAEQLALIDSGNFIDAVQMDIYNIRDFFGGKYDVR